jgi:hypothetical protein
MRSSAFPWLVGWLAAFHHSLFPPASPGIQFSLTLMLLLSNGCEPSLVPVLHQPLRALSLIPSCPLGWPAPSRSCHHQPMRAPPPLIQPLIAIAPSIDAVCLRALLVPFLVTFTPAAFVCITAYNFPQQHRPRMKTCSLLCTHLSILHEIFKSSHQFKILYAIQQKQQYY